MSVCLCVFLCVLSENEIPFWGNFWIIFVYLMGVFIAVLQRVKVCVCVCLCVF